MTQFQQAVESALMGNVKTPDVSYDSKKVDYFWYQLGVHRFNLNIMASGMLCRGIKFTDIKNYYGLKGRSAKDCIEQFQQIMDEYKAKYMVREAAKIQAGQLN